LVFLLVYAGRTLWAAFSRRIAARARAQGEQADARFPTLGAGFLGDPSLRRKCGSTQDDAILDEGCLQTAPLQSGLLGVG